MTNGAWALGRRVGRRFIVGNVPPVVELGVTSPAPGEPFSFGQTVTYQVTITDDRAGGLLAR